MAGGGEGFGVEQPAVPQGPTAAEKATASLQAQANQQQMPNANVYQSSYQQPQYSNLSSWQPQQMGYGYNPFGMMQQGYGGMQQGFGGMYNPFSYGGQQGFGGMYNPFSYGGGMQQGYGNQQGYGGTYNPFGYGGQQGYGGMQQGYGGMPQAYSQPRMNNPMMQRAQSYSQPQYAPMAPRGYRQETLMAPQTPMYEI